MSELELVIQTGNDLVVEEDVFELVFSGAPGPAGQGLPTGGLINQFLRKTSSVVNFATEWFTATAADVGADPAGSAATVQGNLDTHESDVTNPHSVIPSQVAEDVFDNGTKGVDTIIDWGNGAVQSITVSAIINLSFTGWGSLGTLADDKVQSGTLIIIDGDLFEPTFDEVNQGPLPTYTAGFANVQELASLGPDGDIYNMWPVSNDQHVLLGPNIFVAPTLTAPWVDEGGGVYSIDGSQGGNTDLYITGPTETGTKYLVEVTYDDVTASGLSGLSGGATGVLNPQATGLTVKTLITTTGGGTRYGYRANINFIGTVSGLSIRKAL